MLVHLSRLHNILICTGDLLYILFCVAYEDFISYFGMYVGKILIGRFHKRPINADYHDLLTLTCGACQFVLGILTNGEVTPPPSSLHTSLSGRGFGLGCVGVLFGCVGNEGLRRGRTHPPQAVPPPFQGGFLFWVRDVLFGFREGYFCSGCVGFCLGAWWVGACAGGGLTHRKRFPLPFREGYSAIRSFTFLSIILHTFSK